MAILVSTLYSNALVGKTRLLAVIVFSRSLVLLEWIVVASVAEPGD